MPLTEEQKNLITQDFIDIFQAQFGDQWRRKLTTNLKPSPIEQIAQMRGVKVHEVRKIRSQIMAVGRIFHIFETATSGQEVIQ